MKKVIKKLKQSLSILLAVAMVVTCVPQTAALAFAAVDTDIEDAIETEESTDAVIPAEPGASMDGTVLVSDNEADDPADETEQSDMEVGQSEGGTVALGEGDGETTEPTEPTTGEKTITVELKEDDQSITYDGNEHKPVPTIKGKDGQEITDTSSSFTITYGLKDAEEGVTADFKSVGVYTINVKGVETSEDYKNVDVTLEYAIVAADISTGYKITGVDATYTAGDTLTSPTVGVEEDKDNDAKALIAETDYTVEFKKGDAVATDADLKSVGTITVIVTAKGNYKGTLTTTYDIVKATTPLVNTWVSLDFKVDGITEAEGSTSDNVIVVRTGKAIEPKVAVKFTKEGETTETVLTENTDYTVEYKDNVEAGTASVIVTATEDGDYTGSITKAFEIKDTRLDLKDATVALAEGADKKYTGGEIKPEVVVTYTSGEGDDATTETLVKDKDYTVDYKYGSGDKPSYDAGTTVTVTVEGLAEGKYQGKNETFTFTIDKADALTGVEADIYADYGEGITEWTQDLSEYTFTAKDNTVVTGETFAVGTGDNDVKAGNVLDVTDNKAPKVEENSTVLSYNLVAEVPTENVENGTIVVKVTFKNYNDSTLTLTVIPSQKTELYLKGTPVKEEYNGQAVGYTIDKITQHVSNADDAAEVGDDKKIDLATIAEYLTYSYKAKVEGAVASDEAPVDAGTYEVTVSLSTRCPKYKAAEFKADLTIDKKEVTVTAKDRTWKLGTSIPSTTPAADQYEVLGEVVKGDINVEELTFTYKNGETTLATEEAWNALEAETEVTIEVTGAKDESGNYDIKHVSGTLTVKPAKPVAVTTYDVRLHYNQKSVTDVTIKVEAGKPVFTVGSDAELNALYPIVSGYTFLGWYKDPAFSKAWNWNTDTVQGNMDLYAAWEAGIAKADEDGPALYLQDIPDQVYTGSKIQPSVIVSAKIEEYDNERTVVLKKGKDYTITYANNINADVDLGENDPTGGYAENLDDTSHGFNKNLPYIIITGKGNYAGTKAKPNVIYKNFHIEKASIGNGSLASGFTMKYTNQFVAGTKDLKPFTSLKYKKAMTLGTDYDVTITGVANEAFTGEQDADGKDVAVPADFKKVNNGKNNKTAPVIPKGYFGKFTMTVKAKDVNYTGEVAITVIVAKDASKLLKNAKINLGKDIKSVNFAAYINDDTGAVEFPAATVVDGKYYAVNNGAASDVELVGNEKNKYYTVSIKNGKATDYLVAGKDFSISYANNNAVGKATLTIEANENSGYVGSVSTTFTIKGKSFKSNAKNTPIKVTGIDASYPYTGSYITLNDKIKVETADTKTIGEGENAETVPVKEFTLGVDYTVKYANNLKKGTAKVTFTANPTSGYTGSFTKTFKIGQLSLAENVNVGKWGYNDKNEYVFNVVPKTVAEDKKSASVTWEDNALYSMAGSVISFNLRDTEGNTLRVGTDYTAKYSNNKKVSVGETNPKKLPTLTITGKGNYTGKIVITFTIVNNSKGNLGTSVATMQMNAKKADNFEYKPKVTVKERYSGKTLAAKNNYELTYTRNTQADVKKYLDALEAGEDVSNLKPMATVKILNTSSYYTAPGENVSGDEAIAQFDATYNTFSVDLYIFKTKLTSKNCTINLTGNASQYRYTGKQITPEIISVTVKDADKEYNLDADDDYFVSYGANVAAGKKKGSVTIFGLGLYGGSVTTKFDINTSYIYKPAPTPKTELSATNCTVILRLKGEELAKDENGKYSTEATGSQIRPSVEVWFDANAGAETVTGNSVSKKELTRNDDYVVGYGDNKEVGANSGSVTITARGNSDLYTGSFTVNFDIVEAKKTALTAENCTVKLFLGEGDDRAELTKENDKYVVTVDSVTNAIEPEVEVSLNATEEGGEPTKLAKGTDYTVAYSGNTAAGEATVTITGAGKYSGTLTANFTIKVNGETPNPPAEDTRTELTAESCTVKLSLTKDSTVTEMDKDSEKSNVYYVTVEGETVTEAIVPTVEVTLKAAGEGTTDTKLTENTDYTVSIKDNDKIGTATVTIAAVDKHETYKGSFEVTFEIRKSSTTGGEPDTPTEGD